jgi:hypothetical protein
VNFTFTFTSDYGGRRGEDGGEEEEDERTNLLIW